MPFSVYDDEQKVHFGISKSQEPLFAQRMIRIRKCYCERISEYSCRVREGDTVLLSVRF